VQRGDRDTLFLRAKDQMSIDEVRQVREEIAAKARSPIIDDFDRGFFEQWVDILDQLAKLKEEKERS